MLCDVIEVRVQGLDTIRMDRPLPFGSFGLCFHVRSYIPIIEDAQQGNIQGQRLQCTINSLQFNLKKREFNYSYGAKRERERDLGTCLVSYVYLRSVFIHFLLLLF